MERLWTAAGNMAGKKLKASRHKANWVGWVRVTAIAWTCFLLGLDTTEEFGENCTEVGLKD